MRKLAFAGIAGMLVGAAAAAAVASSAVPVLRASNARNSLSAGSPQHPQGVKLTMTLSWEGQTPATASAVTAIDLWFPAGSRYNGASYPACSYAQLNAAGPAACPKGSIMGSGTATAFADTVVTRPRIVAYHLSATIPDRLRVVAGVPIKFTGLQVSAGRGTWLAITAPPAGIKLVTSFSDGTKIIGMVSVQNS